MTPEQKIADIKAAFEDEANRAEFDQLGVEFDNLVELATNLADVLRRIQSSGVLESGPLAGTADAAAIVQLRWDVAYMLDRLP